MTLRYTNRSQVKSRTVCRATLGRQCCSNNSRLRVCHRGSATRSKLECSRQPGRFQRIRRKCFIQVGPFVDPVRDVTSLHDPSFEQAVADDMNGSEFNSPQLPPQGGDVDLVLAERVVQEERTGDCGMAEYERQGSEPDGATPRRSVDEQNVGDCFQERAKELVVDVVASRRLPPNHLLMNLAMS